MTGLRTVVALYCVGLSELTHSVTTTVPLNQYILLNPTDLNSRSNQFTFFQYVYVAKGNTFPHSNPNCCHPKALVPIQWVT